MCFGTAFEEILVMGEMGEGVWGRGGVGGGGMVLDVAIQIRRCADGMVWCFKDRSVCQTGKLWIFVLEKSRIHLPEQFSFS